MRTVTVKKARLLETLKANREIHAADFEITWDAFRERAKQRVDELLGQVHRARRGEHFDLSLGLVPPQDHSEDYDRAIEMVDWEVGDEVVLQEHEFQQYVQDEWGWKAQTALSNQTYTGSESPSSLGLS